MATADPAGALVAAAMEEVELLERLDFHDFKISVKSSSVPTMIEAYRRLAARVPYPLHLGVTEAGPARRRHRQVGDRHRHAAGRRASATRSASRSRPIRSRRSGAAIAILKALGLRQSGPNLIACPSCGRTNVEVHELAGEVDQRLAAYPQHFEVAVMGCAVNGPGEAGNADFGIAGGRDAGFIYAHGEVLRKVPQAELVDELFREIDAWIARGMPRPERGAPMRVIGVVGA